MVHGLLTYDWWRGYYCMRCNCSETLHWVFLGGGGVSSQDDSITQRSSQKQSKWFNNVYKKKHKKTCPETELKGDQLGHIPCNNSCTVSVHQSFYRKKRQEGRREVTLYYCSLLLPSSLGLFLLLIQQKKTWKWESVNLLCCRSS